MFGILAFAFAFYACCALAVFSLKFIAPWTTAVQMERRIDAIRHGRHYQKRYRFVRLSQISIELQHAVIASEDERFREHSGIDWIELRKVIEDDIEHGRKPSRGASTITQQLVRNLFLSTERSGVRKAVEFTIVPLAEALLSKDRILELYLNVIEWGPGIYGAEAASEVYYDRHASALNRDQATRLAACIPAPSRRRPAGMSALAQVISLRMRQMGW